jgi:hypothetical protein
VNERLDAEFEEAIAEAAQIERRAEQSRAAHAAEAEGDGDGVEERLAGLGLAAEKIDSSVPAVIKPPLPENVGEGREYEGHWIPDTVTRRRRGVAYKHGSKPFSEHGFKELPNMRSDKDTSRQDPEYLKLLYEKAISSGEAADSGWSLVRKFSEMDGQWLIRKYSKMGASSYPVTSR